MAAPIFVPSTVDRADASKFSFGGRDGLSQAILTCDGSVQTYSPGYRNPYDLVLQARSHRAEARAREAALKREWPSPALFCVIRRLARGWLKPKTPLPRSHQVLSLALTSAQNGRE